MKVILLHNATAGNGEQPSADQLVGELRQAGHTVVYQSTKEKGSKWAMLEPADLVVAAGGDGTVRKAVLGLAGRDVPLAVLPLGTANNIAKTFGINAPVPEIIHGLENARRARLDLGLAIGPWGKLPFVESAGAGLLARLISRLSHPKADTSAPSVKQGRRQLRKILENYSAQSWVIRVDEREFTAKVLLGEAMNIHLAGPNLSLAPQSDPGDGLLDFVFLKDSAREQFALFLHDPGHATPPLETVRGRAVHIQLPRRESAHIDDTTWPEENGRAGPPPGRGSNEPTVSLEFNLTSEPIEVLVVGA